MSSQINIHGAKEHNLKNLSLSLPHNQLIVFTGLSGSGKSSLAFDTIFAEGQRRYIETFSAYARQFLGTLERPLVDQITGLSPVVAIEQKSTNKSPRSTVGTVTEIYDLLRLLYAKVSTAYSPHTGKPMVKLTESELTQNIFNHYSDQKVVLLAPIVKGRKGHYSELFERYAKLGYTKFFVDNELIDFSKGLKLDRYKIHDIDLVIDRLVINDNQEKRIKSAISQALLTGKGHFKLLVDDNVVNFSKNLICEDTGFSFPDPEPNLFSFNSPYGACKTCNGLGIEKVLDENLIIPNSNKSVNQGAIEPLGKPKNNWIFNQLKWVFKHFDIDFDTPIDQIEIKKLNQILSGAQTLIKSAVSEFEFPGIIQIIEENILNNPDKAKSYLKHLTCRTCNGNRLNKDALQFKINEYSITEVAQFDLDELAKWFKELPQYLDGTSLKIATDILTEIEKKIQFLLDVRLNYLTLDRPISSLSGGEAQRIRLATQIGAKLVGILYILDEPSIGLHQIDNQRLINALKELRDLGNTVLVVEHDKELIENADWVVDIGPKAGIHGGGIVYQGTPQKMLESNTLTASYFNGIKKIEIPKKRKAPKDDFLVLKGASGNNLKNVNLKIPIGLLTCVTGVSGSGKSTLIQETFCNAIANILNRANRNVQPYKTIEGLDQIDKIIEVNQAPIGRTPRSNPSTYTSLFNEIRTLYAQIPESKIRGYTASRFSFNVKGGRCETCKGAGVQTLEMNFIPNVSVTCDTCNGHRYNKETLEIKFKGRSINDVLNMTVEDALEFFEAHPKIFKVLKALNDVGLGYIHLGQSSTTLSGGEAQRVKLATELAKRATGKTLYIFDEPTTGLHFEDINIFMQIIRNLVKKNNTVIIIEHNLDVIKTADYIIDIGPGGGKNGGQIIYEGIPEEIGKSKKSITAPFLLKELKG